MDFILPRGQNIINYLVEKHSRLFLDPEGLIYLIKDLFEDLSGIGSIDNRPITIGQKRVLCRHVCGIILRDARTSDRPFMISLIENIAFPLYDLIEAQRFRRQPAPAPAQSAQT